MPAHAPRFHTSILIGLGALGCAGEPGQPFIAAYQDGKVAALSFTFDDGHRTHLATAALLDQHGLRATFYPVTSWTSDARDAGDRSKITWPEWKDLAARGHEIGNHSASHPDLRKCDDAALERECVASANLITAKVGIAPRSFAYPFCKSDDRSRRLVLANHLAARGYFPLYENDFPAAKANAQVDDAIAKGAWMTWLSHGINDVVFNEHLTHVAEKAKSAGLWVAPFGLVAAYRQERDQAKLTVIERTANSIRLTLTLSPEMPATRWNIPLTVTIPTRSPLSEATVNDPVPPATARIDGDRIQVTLVPDGRTVSVSWR